MNRIVQTSPTRSRSAVSFNNNNIEINRRLKEAENQATKQNAARFVAQTPKKSETVATRSILKSAVAQTPKKSETVARTPTVAKRVSFNNNNGARATSKAKTPMNKKYRYKELKINLEGLQKRLKYTRKILRIKRFTTFDSIYKRYHKKVWGRNYNMNTNRLLQKTNDRYNNKPRYDSRLVSSNDIVFLLNRNSDRYSRDKLYVPRVSKNKVGQLKNTYNINRFRLTKNRNENAMGIPIYRATYTKYQPSYLLSKRSRLMEKLRNHKRKLKLNINAKKQQIRNLGYKVGWFNW
jgi:hypothetical protein